MALYVCTGCKYESDRLYNVIRHEQRIHCNKRLRVCCGKKLYTKGDYYMHCAVHHPWMRARAITSERKYKIRAGTSLITSTKDRGSTLSRDFLRSKRSRRRCDPTHLDSTHQYETKSSERLRGRERRERRFEAEPVEEEKRRGRRKMEDVPLIKSVNGSRRGGYLKKCSPGRAAGGRHRDWKKENDPADETAERNIEGAASGNDGHLVQEARSSPGVFSPLPLKKLLLHRFGGYVEGSAGECGLRELNNNDHNQRNYRGKRMETEEEPGRSRRRNNKRQRVMDKENASAGPQSAEQTVNVKFDDELSGRRVTEIHRDFLSLIDFDTYRIF